MPKRSDGFSRRFLMGSTSLISLTSAGLEANTGGFQQPV